jgi:hypothetical protein
MIGDYVTLLEDENSLPSEVIEATEEKDFDKAFDSFLKGTIKIFDDYMKKSYPNNPKEVIVAKKGKKYIKLIRKYADEQHGSVHAFVNSLNGDVLLPASFKAPAKKSRGNLFDKDNGLGRMGPYGPGYNR